MQSLESVELSWFVLKPKMIVPDITNLGLHYVFLIFHKLYLILRADVLCHTMNLELFE